MLYVYRHSVEQKHNEYCLPSESEHDVVDNIAIAMFVHFMLGVSQIPSLPNDTRHTPGT